MQEYLDEMPWLAIPFGDKRKKTLSRNFDITGEYHYHYKCVVLHVHNIEYRVFTDS